MQTVDFFTPVVDDPETFGAIAAANALSDVYAMGARPLTALSVAAFPERDFPGEWAADIVRGGARVLAEAGCALLGGHTVRDPEIKFGYAVTGLVDPRRMITNAGGRAGTGPGAHQAPGHRDRRHRPQGRPGAGGGGGGRGPRSMAALNRDASEAALRSRRHRGDRRDRLRAPGPRRAAGPRERRDPRDPRGARCRCSRRCSRSRPLTRPPGSRPTGSRSSPRGRDGASTRRSGRCSTTPRPREACSCSSPRRRPRPCSRRCAGARAIGRALPAGPKPLIVRG